MRKFRSELIVLFIILGLIAAGCSNPTNNLLDSFTGINIKSGDSGSAEAIFNSSIHTTELQEVKVGEEVVGTGQYKFVDPALLDVPVDPDAVQSDDAGLYVMRTTDITKVIAGYTYTEGEKAGEKVPAGTAAFQKNGNWYVKEISGYESAITGYTYEDATPVAAGTTVLPGGETGYYVKRVTGYEQVFTGNYKYKDGTIVQGKEILGNADTGYYVQNESTGWWPADVDKMKFPAGNGATVTDTFKVGGAATPYTL
ncbi:MAG: hypothetical protein FWC45_09740, partial [Treponema sp.]|nr:hypothetical protein [Treponema sp.]